MYTIATLTASTMNRNLQIRQPDRTFTSSVVIIVDQCTVLMVIYWPARDTLEDFVDKVLSNVFRRLRTSDVNTTCGSHYHDTNHCECSSRSTSQVCPQYKLYSHTDVLGLYTMARQSISRHCYSTTHLPVRWAIEVPKVNLERLGRRAFACAGPNLWNKLPRNMRDNCTLAQF